MGLMVGRGYRAHGVYKVDNSDMQESYMAEAYRQRHDMVEVWYQAKIVLQSIFV